MIFPISLIAFKRMKKFYCVIISHRTNIHIDSGRVYLGLSDAVMIFPISPIGLEKMRKKVMFWKKNTV